MKYLFALAVLCAAFISSRTHDDAQDPWHDGANPLDVGDVEDRNAVDRMEFLRTRNPATNRIPDNIAEREAAFVRSLRESNKNVAPLAPKADTSLFLGTDSLMQHAEFRTGGRTRVVCADIDDEHTLVAATAGGGIWRSTDFGQSWKKTSPDTTMQGATALCQDPRVGHHGVWYYGTGELFSTGGYPLYTYDIGVGLYKSTDGAKTWVKLKSTSADRQATTQNAFHFCHSIVVDPTSMLNDVVYAATNGCIMRSSDGGTSWTSVLGTAGDGVQIWTDVYVTTHGDVYASIGGGLSAGIWRSADGAHWTQIGLNSIGTPTSRVRIASSAKSPNVLWFYKSSSGTPQIWKYTYSGSGDGSDASNTWSMVSSGISKLLQTQNGYSMSIAVSPSDENLILVGGTSLYLSTDGLASTSKLSHVAGYSKLYLQTHSWNPVTPDLYLYGNSHPDLHWSQFLPSSSHAVVIGCDGGVFTTTDITKTPDVEWTSLNNGLKAEQFYSVSLDPEGKHDGLVAGGAQDNNSSAGFRHQGTMQWILGGDGMVCEVASRHRAIFPSYQGGQVYRVQMNETMDTVLQWVNMRPPGSYCDFIAPMRMDPVYDSILYLVALNGVWRNSNSFGRSYTNDTTSSSSNWRLITLTSSLGVGCSAVGICTTPRNRIYVGSNSGKLVRIDSVHKTTPIVRSLSSSLFPISAYVNNITVDPLDGNSIYVTFSNYEVLSLFHSSDAGVTWECISGNLEEHADGSGAGPACRWLELVHLNGRTLYMVGTTSGVFTTTLIDGMNTKWVQYDGIPNVNVNMIRARTSDGFVGIATHGLSIFSTYVEQNPGGIISSVPLYTNTTLSVELFPNPTSSSVTIRTPISSSGSVLVDIVNEQGNVVAQRQFWADAPQVNEKISVCALATASYRLRVRLPDGGWRYSSFVKN